MRLSKLSYYIFKLLIGIEQILVYVVYLSCQFDNFAV